jgi:hypothetical protein
MISVQVLLSAPALSAAVGTSLGRQEVLLQSPLGMREQVEVPEVKARAVAHFVENQHQTTL